MIMTEAAAHKRLCPLMMPVETENSSSECVGRRCMAWRWAHGSGDIHYGYCGLAGKPEPGPAEIE